MARNSNIRSSYHKSLLAVAAAAALAPGGAWALTLSQSPPGTVEPYVRPNVIISIDDSGSMGYRLNQSGASPAADNNIKTPNPDGTWDVKAPRINILKYALTQVFNDMTLLPDNKIRLAWQTMWNNGKAPGVGPKKSNGYAGATSVDSTTSGVNSMKALDSSHRADFFTFVNSLTPGNNTPAHWMFSQADAYMREPLGVNSPWAMEPGSIAAPYLACRRNYHILMTDGRWNSSPTGGQKDGTNSLTLPDGTVYANGTAAQNAKTALYRDTDSNTLADWAFYSWSTPPTFAGSLSGTMQPATDYAKAPATENFGKDSAGKDAILERYWNPKYNPATWPHMVTYTIGASSDATTWPGAPTIIGPTAQVPFGYDNSFLDLVTGTKTWPSMNSGGEPVRALDLWHAALNGRGRFYAVMKGEDLEKAFREILGQINNSYTGAPVASATSGSNASRTDVYRFIASYDPPNNWKGSVASEVFKTDGTTVSNPNWSGQSTADKLDAAGFNVGTRLVLSFNDKLDASGKPQGGVPFRWASDESMLNNAQKLLLQKDTSGTDQGAVTGQGRLNYVRGDRSMEGSDSSGYPATKPFRERRSRQGDIINSVVWFTGAPLSNYALNGYAAFTRSNKARAQMIYVGGNDGMLHGFAASDGSERLAYVPKGVIRTLNQFTDPDFNKHHKFFVDGSPMSGDVDMGTGIQDPDDPGYSATYSPDWRTLLVGTLGAGGRGYFVLDVTNPDGAGSTPALTETNAQQLVIMDRTRSALDIAPDCVTGLNGTQQAACTREWNEAKDIGHITARPVTDDANPLRTTQITRMNNNRWAVVLGNGYNSANQRPVLLVQYLDGARELLRIPTTADAPGSGYAKDNGLATPRLVDLNGDGRTDVVYAGDNLGNLWKFDLTNLDDAQWQVAFGGAPKVANPDDGMRGNPAGAKPLFTALGPASLGSTARSKIQPISAPPTVRANDRSKDVISGPTTKTVAIGGMMVAFGTGRNVADIDPETSDVQTLYSVLDNTRYCPINTSKGKRLSVHGGGSVDCSGNAIAESIPAPTALGTGVTAAKLAQQKISEIDSGAFGTVDVVDDLKTSTWANYNGWYMDFPSVGERLLKPMQFFDGSNLLTVFSQVPAKGSDLNPNIESCNSSKVDDERQYRTIINIMDGKRPTVQVVDYNHDNVYDTADLGVSRVQVTKSTHDLIVKGDRIVDMDSSNKKELLARMPEQSLRPSWRQLK